MKAFFDACKELGDTCWLHDQYRDYYLDAPSWNPEFAVQEEDNLRPPRAFPGTRFKDDWKDGYIPLMDHWDGGTQGYLNNRFMLGHMVQELRSAFRARHSPARAAIRMYSVTSLRIRISIPEHPSTRTDSMRSRSTYSTGWRSTWELSALKMDRDWVVPYVDYVTPA